jgi:hypothetical protein
MDILIMSITFDESIQSLTPNQRAFLKAYLISCSITTASECAKVSRVCHYAWLKESEAYEIAYRIAEPIAAQNLEDEAVKRATTGWDEPVFYQGEQCGVVRKFSDSLLLALLKGAKPDKYKDRVASTLSNADGSPLVVAVRHIGGDEQ